MTKEDFESIYTSIFFSNAYYDFGDSLGDFKEFSGEVFKILEEYLKYSKWYKVEDELPDKDGPLLVRTENGTITTVDYINEYFQWRDDYDVDKYGIIVEWKLIQQ